MYRFLADESGLNTDEEICVVAGFVGDVDQWESFDAGWIEVLKQFDVPEFHGVDFWDGYFNDSGHFVRKHPFEEWTDHDDYEFIDSLLKVIETCKLKHTGAAVNSRLFLELTPDERRYLTTAGVPDKNWDNRGCPSDPWYAAFQAAIVSGAARFAPEGVKIFPFFDRRDSPHQQKQPKQDKARELYNEILDQKPPLSIRSKLGDILTFGSRETMKGLQAADLLCNRARLYVAEGFGDDLLSVRIRDFLEKGNGYIQMLGLRGMDLALRACPFRSTFWLADELPSLTVPDYLERMRWAGSNVVAIKGSRTGHYYSHYIKPEKIRNLKRLRVSGSGLVYIESPDASIQPAKYPANEKGK